MKLAHRFLSIFIFLSCFAYGQETINKYKYVIVPKNYDFLRLEDQYQLNSLTKFLFTKEGFEAYFDLDSKPREVINNPCQSLSVKVVNNSSMIITKLVIELYNCDSEVVFTSKEGRSKLKDYKKAYYQAMRDAFSSIGALKYKYSGEKEDFILESKAKESTVILSQEQGDLPKDKAPAELEKEESVVEKEVIEAPEKKELNEKVDKEVITEAKDETQEKVGQEPQDKVSDQKVKEEVKKNDVKGDKIKAEPVASASGGEKAAVVLAAATVGKSSTLLYAQETEWGYQLVDSSPKIIYSLLNSSKPDLYILKEKNGIIYKDKERWHLEYYKGNTLITKELEIKF